LLGASLFHVHNITEANAAITENRGPPFDRVYVAENNASESELLGAPTKKRKRPWSTTPYSIDCELPVKIRCLSNELLIQSLIIGGIMERA
jgi:hypothetical protein